jgi:hypothetical protein
MPTENDQLSYRGECLTTGFGLTMPQVSKTGAAQIQVINDGWGFFINGKDGPASYVDFLAVGTDEQQKYDFKEGANSFNGWEHDFGHLIDGSRINLSWVTDGIPPMPEDSELRKLLALSSFARVANFRAHALP